MCCKNRFDQCTSYICIAYYIWYCGTTDIRCQTPFIGLWLRQIQKCMILWSTIVEMFPGCGRFVAEILYFIQVPNTFSHWFSTVFRKLTLLSRNHLIMTVKWVSFYLLKISKYISQIGLQRIFSLFHVGRELDWAKMGQITIKVNWQNVVEVDSLS